MKRRRQTFSFVIALLVIPALIIGLGAIDAIAKDGNVAFWLTLNHNNDGESELLPALFSDSKGNIIRTEGGVAYFQSVLKREQKNSLKKPKNNKAKRGFMLVSSGDNFLASPAFTASLEKGIFYDAEALDRLGYDAISFGNHDYDFGPDLLGDFISMGFKKPGTPPYVSVNIDVSAEPALQTLVDDGVITKSTVVKVRGERFGVIGAITPALATISSPRDVIVLQNVAELVQAEVDMLESMGINKIIFISHLQDVDADIAVISQLSGVDVAVAGGGDELLAPCTTVEDCEDILLPSDLRDGDPDDEDNPPDGIPDELAGLYPIIAEDIDGSKVPVVTTSGQYRYLGQLVVGFDHDGNLVEIDIERSKPIRVLSGNFDDAVKPNKQMQRNVVDPVAEFVADLEANVIATSEVDLDGLRSSVRSKETNEGNLIADALLWQARRSAPEFGAPQADVALQNGGGIRNDSIIPAGNITELTTFDMVPFPNLVTVFPSVSREQFKMILENAVSRINPPPNITGGTGRFAQVSGFSFEYDPDQTAMIIDNEGNVTQQGSRITMVELIDDTLIVDNGIVQPGPDIVVATIDFLARGGDQYPFGNIPFTVLGASYQQALSNYIQAPVAEGGLEGQITEFQYPEGGEGRITEN
jgi:5'-nucleotidase